jgi:hypothetical protein
MSKYDSIVFETDDIESPEDALGDAMETKLGFGKHKGKTLCQLVQTREGRSYLKWITTDDCNIREETKGKCRVVLDFAAGAMNTKK